MQKLSSGSNESSILAFVVDICFAFCFAKNLAMRPFLQNSSCNKLQQQLQNNNVNLPVGSLAGIPFQRGDFNDRRFL